MAHTTIDHLRDLCTQVIELLTARGIHAEYWHSGGGIFGIRIESSTGHSELFTSLDSDNGAFAWTACDWTTRNGDLIANLDVQVRPYGGTYGPVGTPAEFADAFELLVGALR